MEKLWFAREGLERMCKQNGHQPPKWNHIFRLRNVDENIERYNSVLEPKLKEPVVNENALGRVLSEIGDRDEDWLSYFPGRIVLMKTSVMYMSAFFIRQEDILAFGRAMRCVFGLSRIEMEGYSLFPAYVWIAALIWLNHDAKQKTHVFNTVEQLMRFILNDRVDISVLVTLAALKDETFGRHDAIVGAFGMCVERLAFRWVPFPPVNTQIVWWVQDFFDKTPQRDILRFIADNSTIDGVWEKKVYIRCFDWWHHNEYGKELVDLFSDPKYGGVYNSSHNTASVVRQKCNECGVIAAFIAFVLALSADQRRWMTLKLDTFVWHHYDKFEKMAMELYGAFGIQWGSYLTESMVNQLSMGCTYSMYIGLLALKLHIGRQRIEFPDWWVYQKFTGSGSESNENLTGLYAANYDNKHITLIAVFDARW